MSGDLMFFFFFHSCTYVVPIIIYYSFVQESWRWACCCLTVCQKICGRWRVRHDDFGRLSIHGCNTSPDRPISRFNRGFWVTETSDRGSVLTPGLALVDGFVRNHESCTFRRTRTDLGLRQRQERVEDRKDVDPGRVVYQNRLDLNILWLQLYRLSYLNSSCNQFETMILYF